MNTRFKVFASYNILQYLCDFIHVLIFVIVSKCRKNLKLTNIVILWYFFIKIGVYSINSSKPISKFSKALNFNRLSFKLNWFICNYKLYSHFSLLFVESHHETSAITSV